MLPSPNELVAAAYRRYCELQQRKLNRINAELATAFPPIAEHDEDAEPTRRYTRAQLGLK